MPKLSLIFLVIITIITFLSCKKEDHSPEKIFGTWKLIETCTKVEDGSDKRIKATNEGKYISFGTTGTLEGDVFPKATAYKVLDGERIEILGPEYVMLIYSYKIKGNNLEINLPCGWKFKRM